MRNGFGLALLTWLVACGGCSLSSTDNRSDAAGDAAVDAAMVDAGDANTGPQVAVIGPLVPNEECIVPIDAPFLLTGQYDVAGTPGCNASYNLALLINNFIPAGDFPDGAVGISGNAVQVTNATVSLLTQDGSLINTGTLLPNPFSVTTFATLSPASNGQPGRGVALIEVIPNVYRSALFGIGTAGGTIVAEIVLTATTVDGTSVDPEPFRFPIQLCTDCLNLCASTLTPEEINNLIDGICNDNAGADGRACIDSSC